MSDPNAMPPDAVSDNKDERMWAMLCHLSTFSGFLIPLGNIIGPLVIWAMKKDEYPLVDDQGKEALNFQITVTIAAIISIILIFVLVGILLISVVILVEVILTIIAAIKANDGVRYRYPFTIRLIS